MTSYQEEKMKPNSCLRLLMLAVLITFVAVSASAAPVTINYAYDDLNRLTTAECVGGPTETFVYDEIGNRTNYTVAGTGPVDDSGPSLTLANYTDNQHLDNPNVILTGTASDSGNGANGVFLVAVNGGRAVNSTAMGGGTANWSRSMILLPGANTINIIAHDNSTNQNQTTQTLTLYFDFSPAVATNRPTGVIGLLATLNGTVNPNGLDTTYYFQWGRTVAYGNTTPTQSAGSGSNDTAVSADITGLSLNATYHYRLVATNSKGTTYGTDVVFIGGGGNTDFNADGNQDILWRNKVTGGIVACYMNGVTGLGAGTIADSSDLNWDLIGTADFNDDGNPDLLWRHKTTGAIVVAYMNGVTGLGAGTIADSSDLNWDLIGTADFNNDGNPDLLWRHKTTGAIVVAYMNGVDGIGTRVIADSSDLNWDLIGTADFNNDGNPDLLWRHKTTGAIVVAYMNGVTGLGAGTIADSSDLNWDLIGTADFNNDGNPDLLWRHKTTGAIVVAYMNGVDGIGTGTIANSSDLNWEIVAP
jgi:YD repeat-containing protein